MFILLHGSVILYYGWEGNLNKYLTPIWMIVSRDIVFAFSMIYIFIASKRFYLSKEMSYLGGAIILLLLVAVLHFVDGYIDTIQHSIRNLLLYSLFIFVIPNIQLTEKDIHKLIRLFIKVLLLISAVGFITLADSNYLYGGRVISTLYNPNTAAAILMLGILTIFPIMVSKYKTIEFKTHKYLVIAVLIMALIVTGSFSNMWLLFFALAIQVVVMWKFRVISLKKFMRIILFIFSIIFIAWLSGWIDPVINRFFDIFINNQGTSIVGRINQYEKLLFIDNEFTSIFFGEFKSYTTHDSMYIQLFRNNGFVGLFGYLFIIFFSMILSFRMYKRAISNKNRLLPNLHYFYIGFFAFTFVEVFAGFFVTAIFYRFPVNAIFFFFYGLIFKVSPNRWTENR